MWHGNDTIIWLTVGLITRHSTNVWAFSKSKLQAKWSKCRSWIRLV